MQYRFCTPAILFQLYLSAAGESGKVGSSAMPLVIKLIIVAFLIFWTFVGGWLIVKYGALFGPHHDHRAETPGARSFGLAHIGAVWVGAFALGIWFLFL
jgi:hypothetical protein